MLVKGVIFARMSPDEKAELVERLQSLGYTVAFCGDGANDCGALKAADVGVSLSEAEASVAAPFTSRTPDISCVVEIIRCAQLMSRSSIRGPCSQLIAEKDELLLSRVSVVSNTCESDVYNMIQVADPHIRALYSLIQFTTVTLLYSFASSLGDFQ